MKVTFPFALAAALIFGCSSSNKNTKTAENDTGITQPSSVSGAAPTAGTQATPASGTSVPPPSDTSGSMAQGSTSGSSISGSADNASLRTVTGGVAKVDQNSITLDQAAGGVTLTVDSQTQVLRRGQPIAAG